MDLGVKAMTKVLVKAYLPTLDEKRGVSLDDIESLRWIPSRRRKTFSKPLSVSRSTRVGTGENIPWELGVLENKGKPLPGLLDPNNPGQINPNVDVSGTWVGPSNIGTLLDPDFTFDPRKDQATLLGITETPHWFRDMKEGAKTHAGEGFQYGGFDKDAFVEIPLPKSADPQSISNVAFNMIAPPFYQKDLGKDAEEIADFISQFPQTQGTGTWRQKVGDPLTLQQLIDQGHLMPLSENQKILNSPFIQTGEPMDIAMRLLKLELAPPMTQGVEEQVPMQEDIPMVDMAMGDYESPCECAEKIRSEIFRLILDMEKRLGEDFSYAYKEWQGYECQEILEWAEINSEALKNQLGIVCDNGGISEADQMKYTGEPMDLAFDAIKKNLNRWFKEKWVDVSRKDKDGKHPPCGRSKASKSSKGYPKCRPSVKVSSKTPKTSGSMSEGQKRAATKRKRSKKQGVGGKPTIVKVE